MKKTQPVEHEVPEQKEEKETTPVEGDQKAESNTSSNAKSTSWVIVAVVLVVLLIGAVYAGQQAELRFGDVVYKALPETMKRKEIVDGDIQIHPKKEDDSEKPNEEIIPPLLPPLLASDGAKKKDDNPDEPFVVPDGDVEESPYILLSSSTTKLTKEDLVSLSDFELKKARNEIYARHGRPFVHKDMQCYFSQQSWYTLDPNFSEKSLSSLETANAVFILNYEKERQSPYVAKDTGCNGPVTQ